MNNYRILYNQVIIGNYQFMTSSNPLAIIDNRQLPALNLNIKSFVYKEYKLLLVFTREICKDVQILINKLQVNF